LAVQNNILGIFGEFSRDAPETETELQIPQTKTYSQSEVTLGTKTK
jgi:hypothetical protein